MTLSTTRIRAIVRKELRDYRQNRFIVITMTVVPLIFVALPIIDIFTLAAACTPAGFLVRPRVTDADSPRPHPTTPPSRPHQTGRPMLRRGPAGGRLKLSKRLHEQTTRVWMAAACVRARPQ